MRDGFFAALPVMGLEVLVSTQSTCLVKGNSRRKQTQALAEPSNPLRWLPSPGTNPFSSFKFTSCSISRVWSETWIWAQSCKALDVKMWVTATGNELRLFMRASHSLLALRGA